MCLDTLIQTLGVLLDFRKGKTTRLVARVFLTLISQVSQHPACLDQSIQTRKTNWYFFNHGARLKNRYTDTGYFYTFLWKMSHTFHQRASLPKNACNPDTSPAKWTTLQMVFRLGTSGVVTVLLSNKTVLWGGYLGLMLEKHRHYLQW